MSRRELKKALKECIKNEHNEMCLSTVNIFHRKDKTQFVKDVKKNKSFSKLFDVIGGQSGDININIF